MTREEKLILLVEECGEVIQAATKCLRFGWHRDQPGYGVNHIILAREVGDLQGVVASLPLDDDEMQRACFSKIGRAVQFAAQVRAEQSEAAP